LDLNGSCGPRGFHTFFGKEILQQDYVVGNTRAADFLLQILDGGLGLFPVQIFLALNRIAG
jgi:hypothetical protein